MKKLLFLSIVIGSLPFYSGAGTKSPKEITGTAKVVEEVKACSEIFVGSVLAACLYGIVNDQVSARVCPEYFTQGFHRRNVEDFPEGWLKDTLLTTDSPTKLGLIWGVLGTWWMGAGLSVPIMASARIGSYPKLRMKDLVKPTGIALGAMGLYSLYEGIRGYRLAASGQIYMDRYLGTDDYLGIADGTPDESLNAFIANDYAHNAAYGGGVLAALGLSCWTIYARYKKYKDLQNHKHKLLTEKEVQ